MNCSLPGSSVCGIFQARILEWVVLFSKGSSWPRDWTHISCIGRQILYHLATWEPQNMLTILKCGKWEHNLIFKVGKVFEETLHHKGSLSGKWEYYRCSKLLDFPCGLTGEESTCNVGDLGSIPGLGRPPGEGKVYCSSIPAWRIPWTVWSVRLQRVGHDWENSLIFKLNFKIT